MMSCDCGARAPAGARGCTETSDRPYSALRAASSSAGAIAAATPPPAPSTPTTANCEAPVKTSSDIAQVFATDSPAATASTPYETA